MPLMSRFSRCLRYAADIFLRDVLAPLMLLSATMPMIDFRYALIIAATMFTYALYFIAATRR